MKDFLLIYWPQTRSFKGCRDFTVYCNAMTANCDISLEQGDFLGSVLFTDWSSLVYHISSCLDKLQLSLDRAAVPLPGCRRAGAHETYLMRFKLIYISAVCVWGKKLQEHSLFFIQPLLLLTTRTHGLELRAGAIGDGNCASPILALWVLVGFRQLVCRSAWLLLALSPWADVLPRQAGLSLDVRLHALLWDKGSLTSTNSKHGLVWGGFWLSIWYLNYCRLGITNTC